jgi:cysteinyl-tRNA synthetase
MGLMIYNTLTRKKELFKSLQPGKVLMYVCGPTVYNKAHIGHAMSVLVFDIIRRYLRYKGYEVICAMNYTDVDDKIIKRANELNMDPFELAESYVKEFQQHIRDLNILPMTINPRATQEIDNIIQIIKGLMERSFAYEVDGDVYFRVQNDKDYGKLSGRRLEDMQAGARIEIDKRKEHPMDFALWKAARPGEPSWDSPWGKGRPGWHIECSAMTMSHLGEQIDIHGGGNDLIFPHHENEIAQSESLTGKPFARYWIHNGMLQLKGEKMSKSVGNLITIEEFLEKHHGDALRMMVLNSGYRNPLTYNDVIVAQSEQALNRLRSALRPALPNAAGIQENEPSILSAQVEKTKNGFIECMDDDFNSAGALGYIFEMVRVINQARDAGATEKDLSPAQSLLRELTGTLGLKLDQVPAQEHPASAFIEVLIQLRNDLRQQKLFSLADKVRERLNVLGVDLEDSKDGTTWHWRSN